MLICPHCKQKMGRDHRCSGISRRHFFFGLMAGSVGFGGAGRAVALPLTAQQLLFLEAFSHALSPDYDGTPLYDIIEIGTGMQRSK